MEGNRELSTPSLPPRHQQVFVKRAYPPCYQKPRQRQPWWWDTWRRNWAEDSRELYTPSLPPTPNKSLTTVGTHLVVARNPAGESHHGAIHGERIRWKATENCPPHPYTPTRTKSLTNVVYPPCCCQKPSQRQPPWWDTWRRKWAEDNRELSTPSLPLYHQKVFDSCGYPPCCYWKPSRRQPPWSDTWRRKWWKATENCPPHPYPHKVFDKRGYPPYCCRKSSRQQPPWWDTWRRNWAERQHRRWTFRCSAAWTTTSAVLCWSRQTGSLSWM